MSRVSSGARRHDPHAVDGDLSMVRPTTDPAAALDWLVRIRPATWLRAAGAVEGCSRLMDCGAVRRGGDLQSVWPLLAELAPAIRQERTSAWRSVRDGLSEVNQRDLWGALADATWGEAAGAAANLLHRAVASATPAADGLNPGDAVLRTLAIPDTPPSRWEVLWDVPLDAASVTAWRALGRWLGEPSTALRSTIADAWLAGQRSARTVLAPVTATLAQSARQAGIRGPI